MTTIADRLSLAQSRIVLAAEKCARDSQEIQLLAVSKTKPIAQILAAYAAGQRSFGENYVQEGQEKIQALQQSCPDIQWHFIGPLQSNKTRIVAEHFDWMHTVSRLKIAQRLDAQRPNSKAPLNVCIQVNISQEDSKSGCSATEAITLASEIQKMPNLKLRGLMAIPTATDDIHVQNLEFAELQKLYQVIAATSNDIDTLSMGMSNDLEQAIAHGSTLVRIGSAIFGARG